MIAFVAKLTTRAGKVTERVVLAPFTEEERIMETTSFRPVVKV